MSATSVPSSRNANAARRPGGTDVARLAGVSQKTVSRVFNGEPTVSEETRERVLSAAARLGYRPNGAARALLTGRTYRIGVVSLGTAHFGPSSLLIALERATRSTGYSLSIAHTFEDDPDGLRSAADRLLAQGVDAIILSEPIDDAGEPLEADVPVLTLGTAPAVRAPTVLSVPAAEGGDAAAAATRYLLGLGHQTVHHIAGPRRWWAARARLQNWRDALEAAGARYRNRWRATGRRRAATRSAGDSRATAMSRRSSRPMTRWRSAPFTHCTRPARTSPATSAWPGSTTSRPRPTCSPR